MIKLSKMKKNITIIILFVFSALSLVYAKIKASEAEKNAEMARELSIELESSEQEAIRQREIAMEAMENARAAQDEAAAQAQLAKEQLE
jgi:hypothetical protein